MTPAPQTTPAPAATHLPLDKVDELLELEP